MWPALISPLLGVTRKLSGLVVFTWNITGSWNLFKTHESWWWLDWLWRQSCLVKRSLQWWRHPPLCKSLQRWRADDLQVWKETECDVTNLSKYSRNSREICLLDGGNGSVTLYDGCCVCWLSTSFVRVHRLKQTRDINYFYAVHVAIRLNGRSILYRLWYALYRVSMTRNTRSSLKQSTNDKCQIKIPNRWLASVHAFV